jgi:DNA-binding CsgD family transcriptional regulator
VTRGHRPGTVGRDYGRIDMERLRQLHAQRKTDRQIAEAMGRLPDGIGRARRRAGLPINPDYKGGPPKYNVRAAYHLIRMDVENHTIAKVIGCSVATVNTYRRQIGKSNPPGNEYTKSLPPFAERLKEAERMVEEGASFAEIQRTLHLSREVLAREFPGKQWTLEQTIQHALSIRYAEKRINEVWSQAGHTRLTNPPS